MPHGSPVSGSSSLRITGFSLEKGSMRVDEGNQARLSFRLEGGIRELFDQGYWERSYDAGERGLRIRYRISLLKAGLVSKKVMERKLARKATFYWSRNPNLPFRIWCMVINEDEYPKVPSSVEEARSLLMDVEASMAFLGTDVGKGEHRLVAHVEARWMRHHMLEPIKLRAISREARLTCL